jgi:hypothetical protein
MMSLIRKRIFILSKKRESLSQKVHMTVKFHPLFMKEISLDWNKIFIRRILIPAIITSRLDQNSPIIQEQG